MTVAAQKQQLRAVMRAELQQMTAKLREEQSEKICQQLIALQQQRSFSRIAVYMPFTSEVTVLPAVKRWREQGVSLFIPSLTTGGKMEMQQFPEDTDLKVLQQNVHNGFYTERYAGLPWEDSGAAVLVPGIAFTHTGARLGRGGGYYDIWMAAHQKVFRIGVCFEEQLLSKISVAAHDEAVQLLIHG